MFATIRAAQLTPGSITHHDALLLNRMWESDPTVAIAREEGGWFVEVGSDEEPDENVRAAVNDFLKMTFRDWGLSPRFLTLVQAAQAELYQFVRIANR